MPARTPPPDPFRRRFQTREVAVAFGGDTVPKLPRRSRGPALLFFAGAVVAAVLALAQFFDIAPPEWLATISGGQASAARAPRVDNGVVMRSLDELHKQYGEPKDASYGRLRIPSIGVDAPMGVRKVGKDGVMHDPSGPGDVVWYDFEKTLGLGGAPGAGGNTVLAGHVDQNGMVEYAGVRYTGPAVFFSLDQLGAGDAIEVTVAGKTWRYAVVWIRSVPVDEAWEPLFSSKVLGDTITLVTCGGDFDYDTQEYTSRLVVRAVRG